MNAYGTSIGHILLESIDELSGSISSGPISEKISLDSPVRSLKISVCQLEIFILVKTDNGIYLVTMPQLGSSLSCKHHIRKVGFFADEISCSKNKFVWREGNTVFAGNFCLPVDIRYQVLIINKNRPLDRHLFKGEAETQD